MEIETGPKPLISNMRQGNGCGAILHENWGAAPIEWFFVSRLNGAS
jgi:hypothetical protein